MLKSEQTVAASRSAWSETPAARTASASAGVSSSGRSVSFSRKTSVAIELGTQRRGPPVVDDRLPDVLTERVRRNCAVGVSFRTDTG